MLGVVLAPKCRKESSTGHHITQALTEEHMMNSKQRYNARRMTAHNAAKAAESSKDIKLEKRVGMSLSGCSARVYKATMSLPLRSKEQASADNICLPDVAIFAAGHRKPTETITAR